MEYRFVPKPDDNGTLLVSFPDFPDAHTFGVDEQDARRRAADALETAVMACMKDQRPLPKPKASKKGERVLSVSASMAAAMGLYLALRERQMTNYALAKKLGWHQPQVDRLFDVRYQSKLEQLEAAAVALGKRLEIQVA